MRHRMMSVFPPCIKANTNTFSCVLRKPGNYTVNIQVVDSVGNSVKATGILKVVKH